MRPSNRFWLALCDFAGCRSLFLGALAVRSRFAAGIRLETHAVRRNQSPQLGEAHGTVIGQTPAHIDGGGAVIAAPAAFCMDKKSLFLAVNGLFWAVSKPKDHPLPSAWIKRVELGQRIDFFWQPPSLGLPGGLEEESP